MDLGHKSVGPDLRITPVVKDQGDVVELGEFVFFDLRIPPVVEHQGDVVELGEFVLTFVYRRLWNTRVM